MSHPKKTISRLESFSYAFKGIIHVFRTEVNFRIHLFATLAIIALGLYFKVGPVDWSLLILSIGSVIGAEMFNTAIEFLCDKIQPNFDPLIGRIKDIASGAVLLIAMAASFVGFFVFYPHLIHFIR